MVLVSQLFYSRGFNVGTLFNHDKSENNVFCFILKLHAFVSGCLDFEQSFC